MTLTKQTSPYKLLPIERETIILFNEAEKTATVNTCNRSLTKQLKEFSQDLSSVVLISEDIYGAEFEIPKSMISIHKPRVLTKEQKKVIADRFAAIRALKSNPT